MTGRDISGFIAIWPTVVLAWILVELWSNVINIFAYKFLRLNIDSIVHSLIIAVVMTFLLYFSMCIHTPTANADAADRVSFSNPELPGTGNFSR